MRAAFEEERQWLESSCHPEHGNRRQLDFNGSRPNCKRHSRKTPLIRQLGFNTVMRWPVMEAMPPPLSPEDAEAVRVCDIDARNQSSSLDGAPHPSLLYSAFCILPFAFAPYDSFPG